MSQSKVILITGTSSGFGNLSARQLAEKGHKVYASMRGIAEKNAAKAKGLAQAPGNIQVLELDVTEDKTIQAAVNRVMAEQGRIDVLINNAGVLNVGLTEGFTVEQLQQQMDVNYFGVARMFKAVLPGMREQGDGLIITVTSIAGRIMIPALHSYNSSKFAVEALAEGYRYELSQYGVDSVIVEPGPFKTALMGNAIVPKEEHVLKSYGTFAEMPQLVLSGFETFIDENKAGEADPKIVVDDIENLIDLPFGERPLRTVSGVDYGVREVNKIYEGFQRIVLENMEMGHLDPNRKPKSVGVA